VPQDEEQSNCPAKEIKKKNLVMGPKGMPDTKMDRPTDHRSLKSGSKLSGIHQLLVSADGVS
jgi:hypothetical protein